MPGVGQGNPLWKVTLRNGVVDRCRGDEGDLYAASGLLTKPVNPMGLMTIFRRVAKTWMRARL
jgi:hypothetical protein